MISLRKVVEAIRDTKGHMKDCPLMDCDTRFTVYLDTASFDGLLLRWQEDEKQGLPPNIFLSELKYCRTIMGALVVPVRTDSDYLKVYVE